MGTTRFFFLLFIIVGLVVGCSDSGNIVDSTPTVGVHTYIYTASLEGKEVITGKIILNVDEKGNLTGTWELERIGPSSLNTGPQIGTGQLAGTIDGANVFISLHPGKMDDYVDLKGEFVDGQFVGKWIYNTMIGPSVQGDFEAKIDAGTPIIPGGIYKYGAFDSRGTIIVSGILSLTIDDKGTIAGTWTLEKIGSPLNIGPQVGSGKLTGQQDGTIIYINFNPDYLDNNVLLTGKFENRKISGRWTWVTIAGPFTEGEFEATKM